MSDTLSSMLSYLPMTAVPVLLLLLAPLAGQGTRAAFAAVLGLGGVGLVVLAVRQAGQPCHLDVVNYFMNPERGEPVPFVVDRVEAAGWEWPIAAAAFLVAAALLLFATSRVSERPPHPVRYAGSLTLWVLAARLVLEKTAAPEALTLAIGVTVPTLLILPFIGYWVALRGHGYGRLVVTLLLLALVQRSMIVVWGYFATAFDLGTHLDVSAIRHVTLPLGPRDFSGPGDQATAQWLYLIVIPQYVLWVPMTLVAGLALGTVPFLLARRGE